MSAVEIPAVIQNGMLPAAVQQRLAAVLSRMEGKRIILTVREQKRRRSLNQNAYYWGVVVEMVTGMFREAGNNVNPEEVHEFLKLRVGKLSRVMVTPHGEVVKSLASTTSLSTQEFEVYLEKVRAWAAEFGLVIPLPNEEAA